LEKADGNQQKEIPAFSVIQFEREKRVGSHSGEFSACLKEKGESSWKGEAAKSRIWRGSSVS